MKHETYIIAETSFTSAVALRVVCLLFLYLK